MYLESPRTPPLAARLRGVQSSPVREILALTQRPGVISGTAFFPETAPWLKIINVKQSGDHLYLRYAGFPRRG